MSTILYDANNHVATITLNSPETANGFSIPLCESLLSALKQANDDADIRAVVVRGNGPLFSAGGDLKDMKRIFDAQNHAEFSQLVGLVSQVSMYLKEMPKPVIFLVYGAVAGAAFNMALAADFVIAKTGTKFIQAFVNVGLAPDAGGMFLLTRALGMNRALHLVMTGKPVTAEQGLDLGFVYDTYESDDDREVKLEALLHQLLQGPQRAFATMKQMLWKSTLQQWPAYAADEQELQSNLIYAQDSAEGVNAFLEKRKPKFTGQ